ncbi:redox-regulated ATPase YchF, partial [Bacillus cereus]|nr:redox-regulated ATPase YchF [Bacillus cereus]
GLGNKFLAHIREVDAIVHVVRCFEDENITHVDGKIDPISDIQTINLELILADIESVDKRIERSRKNMKGGNKQYTQEVEVLE